MAELVFTNGSVRGLTSGSVVGWSTFIRGVTINYSAEIHDKTVMLSSGRKRIGGLKDASITLEFNQDYTDNKVDETLWNLVGSSSGWIQIKPTTAIVAAANPRYYGKFVLESYSPLSGNVGDLQAPSVTFQANGLLQRSVAAT